MPESLIGWSGETFVHVAAKKHNSCLTVHIVSAPLSEPSTTSFTFYVFVDFRRCYRKSETSSRCRLGCRLLFVSPTLLKRELHRSLVQGRHNAPPDLCIATLYQRAVHLTLEQSQVIRKMFFSLTSNEIFDRLVRGSVRSFCRQNFFGFVSRRPKLSQSQGKQTRYQPIKDSGIGWVIDHFSYHLTLLKREVHRSLVQGRNTQIRGLLMPTLT